MSENNTRQIIAGFNHKNESKILSEQSVQAFMPYDMFPSFNLQELFYTEDHPQTLATRHLQKAYDINMPQGAMRFLKIRMPTKKEMIADLQKTGQPIPDDWTKYNLHSTDSVDYLYVLSGKITCVVGEDTMDLSEGDFLVQVGAEHTWINDHDEPCYLFCVMTGIEPSSQRKNFTTI